MPGFMGQGVAQFFNLNGVPNAGGFLYVYQAGSYSIMVDTYNDWADSVNQTNPQPNPVPLDSQGEAVIILTQSVNLVLKDVDGNTLWTVPNYSVADAINTSTGGYKFLNNSIVDQNNNICFSFNTVTNANSYLTFKSAASNGAAVITVTNSGSTNQNINIIPQNAGAIVIGDPSVAGNNTILLTPSTAGSSVNLGVGGLGGTNVGMTISTKGAGQFNVNTGGGNVTYTMGSGIFSIHADGGLIVTGNSGSGAGSVAVGGSLIVSGSASFNLGLVAGLTSTFSTNLLVGTSGLLLGSGPGIIVCNDLQMRNASNILLAHRPNPSAVSGSVYVWPTTTGTANARLITDGSGNLSWLAPILIDAVAGNLNNIALTTSSSQLAFPGTVNTLGNWSNSTFQYTVPRTGVYMASISGFIGYPSGINASVFAILKNTLSIASTTTSTSNGNILPFNVTYIMNCNSGDIINFIGGMTLGTGTASVWMTINTIS